MTKKRTKKRLRLPKPVGGVGVVVVDAGVVVGVVGYGAEVVSESKYRNAQLVCLVAHGPMPCSLHLPRRNGSPHWRLSRTRQVQVGLLHCRHNRHYR